jgi:hypothetical protein
MAPDFGILTVPRITPMAGHETFAVSARHFRAIALEPPDARRSRIAHVTG